MANRFFIGMQTWYITEFLNKGIEETIDSMIKEGAINTLLLGINMDYETTKNWGRLAHSDKEFLETGGCIYDIDLKYYEKTTIKPLKTKLPEFRERDLLSEITEKAKQKGMEVYALIIHRFQEVNNYPDLHMRAINGEKIPSVLCHNNPEVQKFYKCMIDNIHEKYKIDGFCLGLLDHYALFGFQTLTDELASTLGIKRFSNPALGLSCFCNVCVNQAKNIGIDVKKIKKGLLRGIEMGYIPDKIEKMSKDYEAIGFLLNVPEYLEWLRFRSSRLTEFHKVLYEYIKNKNENYKVGLDIYGAKDDWKYQTKFIDIVKYCDWIKPMFYSSTYEGSLGPKEIGEGVMLAKILSSKPIYAGINCLISEPKKKISESVLYAIKNNTDGIVLSFDYALIPDNHMNVVRDKLKELKAY